MHYKDYLIDRNSYPPVPSISIKQASIQYYAFNIYQRVLRQLVQTGETYIVKDPADRQLYWKRYIKSRIKYNHVIRQLDETGIFHLRETGRYHYTSICDPVVKYPGGQLYWKRYMERITSRLNYNDVIKQIKKNNKDKNQDVYQYDTYQHDPICHARILVRI